jgi:hypothetical protein
MWRKLFWTLSNEEQRIVDNQLSGCSVSCLVDSVVRKKQLSECVALPGVWLIRWLDRTNSLNNSVVIYPHVSPPLTPKPSIRQQLKLASFSDFFPTYHLKDMLQCLSRPSMWPVSERFHHQNYTHFLFLTRVTCHPILTFMLAPPLTVLRTESIAGWSVELLLRIQWVPGLIIVW